MFPYITSGIYHIRKKKNALLQSNEQKGIMGKRSDFFFRKNIFSVDFINDILMDV